MAGKVDGEGWATQYTAHLAKRILQLRKERRMSAQQLSDATAELGYRVHRSVISNFENGRREGMDVRELLVLAQALDVTPFEILAAPSGSTEILPGQRHSRAEILAWALGPMPQSSKLDDAGSLLAAAVEAAAAAEKALSGARNLLAGSYERPPLPAPTVDDYDDSAGVL